MGTKKGLTPEQQLVDIQACARTLAKVLQSLSPKGRQKWEARIAKAWKELQPSEWTDTLVAGEIIRWLREEATNCDDWIKISGEAEVAVETRARRNALAKIKMVLNDDYAPAVHSTKSIDADLVGRCVTAWRPSQRKRRGAPAKSDQKPNRHALTALLLKSLGVAMTADAVRVHEMRKLK